MLQRLAPPGIRNTLLIPKKNNEASISHSTTPIMFWACMVVFVQFTKRCQVIVE